MEVNVVIWQLAYQESDARPGCRRGVCMLPLLPWLAGTERDALTE